MLAIVGTAISYICQLFIILYVASEFGWITIKKKVEKAEASTSDDKATAPAQQNNPFGALMQNMGPMVAGMMEQMQKGQGAAPQQPQVEEADPATDRDEDDDDFLLEQELGSGNDAKSSKKKK